jgi:phosphohistidine phosphatase
MKTLLIIRHAKSGWEDASLADFDRILTERGKDDARMMAKRMISKSIKIDAFVSSPAKRAKKTAKLFMSEYGMNEKDLLLVTSLYEATVQKFYAVVGNLNDKNETVALYAHNPTITEFINSLESSPIYNMPTCAVFALKIRTDKWKEFGEAEKEFLFFDYPKNLE